MNIFSALLWAVVTKVFWRDRNVNSFQEYDSFEGKYLSYIDIIMSLPNIHAWIAKQNRDIHMYDPISNAIFNNSTTNPPVYRIVGFMRLHSEIGT